MELKEAIDRRRSIRDFQNKKVPKNIIDYAIKNAFKAPTNNHLREWNFIIINSLESRLKLIDSEKLNTSIDITKLASAFENKDAVMKEMYMDAIPKQKKMILSASSVIIVVYKPQYKVEEVNRIYDLSCLASIWASIENFLLSITEHDVYGVTYIPQKNEIVKERFGIPSELEIAAIIPIGYKAENARIIKQKIINIDEHIHHEEWTSNH